MGKFMARITVVQLAKIVNINEELLLKKLRDVGVFKNNAQDVITNREKSILLNFIRSNTFHKKNPSTKINNIQSPPVTINNVHSKTTTPTILPRSSYDYQSNDLNFTNAPSIISQKPLPFKEGSIKNVDLVVDLVKKFVFAPKCNVITVDKKNGKFYVDIKVKEFDLFHELNFSYLRKSADPVKFPICNKHEDDFFCNYYDSFIFKFTEKESIYSKRHEAKNIPSKPTKNFKSQKKQLADTLQFSKVKVPFSTVNKTNTAYENKGIQTKIKRQKFIMPEKKISRDIVVFDGMKISFLAQRMSIKSSVLINHLAKLDIVANANTVLDHDTLTFIIEDMGHQYIQHKKDRLENEVLISESHSTYCVRPPIVTIMGHIDHGKTSLLDCIRKTNLASNEAGGITQHIGAYSVKRREVSVTFVDTPGHELFKSMRLRGAYITDIIVIVIAADDGVMPQSIEAIQHAQSMKIPIIIAINKIDKLSSKKEKIKSTLSQYGVISEDWGGDTIFVDVSAKKNIGIDNLLDAILLRSSLLDIKASPSGFAKGVIVDCRIKKGLGIVATLIVQDGLLKPGDFILCASHYGRVRVLLNDLGKNILEAGPSMPVTVLGLPNLPNAGDQFVVVKNEKTARSVAELRLLKSKDSSIKNEKKMTVSDLFTDKPNISKNVFNIILKADTQGSLEAILTVLRSLSDNKNILVISSGVGNINVNDISLASTSKSLIFCFNVKCEISLIKQATVKNVQLKFYSVIYELIDAVKECSISILSPISSQESTGLMEIKNVFSSSNLVTIAGCKVLHGVIKKNLPIRVLRESTVIYTGPIESIKHFKNDVNEVKKGMECGIILKNFNKFNIGDKIESLMLEK
jgi:translation initiation factor IF-2